MKHIGFWTPIPPQRTGIADYSDLLLSELVHEWEITVVIDERVVNSSSAVEGRAWRPPEGVDLIDSRAVRPGQFDFNVYQMGNNAEFHAFMHRHALDVPGLLVLHDPSLYDFYVALCGGDKSQAFLDEVEHDLGDPTQGIPRIRVGERFEVDRLALLMSRRLTEASAMTIVHSDWARSALLAKIPYASIRRVFLPARILQRPLPSNRNITFGIIGGINHHKRVIESLSAFAEFHRQYSSARLVIAGRMDVPEIVDEIEHFVVRNGLAPSVETRYDVDECELERLLLSCDVLLALRWPTAGETSALVMRAFGAGVAVITSDVPQSREFDEAYCWRVAIDEPAESQQLAGLMRAAAKDLAGIRAAGRAAQRWMESSATYPKVAAAYSDAICACLTHEGNRSRMNAQLMPPVVNAIGCWTATTGLAEAARRSIKALSEAGVGVALTDYEVDVPKDLRRATRDLLAMSQGRPGAIDLCFLNINEMHGVNDEFLRSDPARYLIAYWFWELPELPPQLRPEVRRFDEIWVASHFVKGNLVPYTSAPIHVMPAVVQPDVPADLSRRDFGLPEEACTFLFNFDASSGIARKNPFGIIDAFKLAFADVGDRDRVCLVMKTLNLARWPEAEFDLRRRVSEVGGIVLDHEFTAAEMSALTNVSDVYVSLHRSEGFGLGIAEAMYFGVPVIATRYSGSEEFLSSANSCGVGFHIRNIDTAELRYNPSSEMLYRRDMQWAEPKVQQAARWMWILYQRPDVRYRVGIAGAETIHLGFSAMSAGIAMRRRLETIARRGSGGFGRRESETALALHHRP